MSRYGSPILQTDDPIGDFLGRYQSALAKQQAAEFRRQALARQDAEFAYRRKQDETQAAQGQRDAQAFAAAMGGQSPALGGVSLGGLAKIAEIQQRGEEARTRRLDNTLRFLEPHVLSGSTMASANYDKALGDFFGEDYTGSADALRRGKFDLFVQQKQMEKQIALDAKMAEARAMEAMQAPERLARLSLAGLPTSGLDGTDGPPDPLSQALYSADPSTANQWMNDRRSVKAPFDPSAIGDLPGVTPEKRDAIVKSSALKGEFDDEMYRASLGNGQARATLDPGMEKALKLKFDTAVSELARLRKLQDDNPKDQSLPMLVKTAEAGAGMARKNLIDFYQNGAQPQFPPVNPGETREQYIARVKAMMGAR